MQQPCWVTLILRLMYQYETSTMPYHYRLQLIMVCLFTWFEHVKLFPNHCMVGEEVVGFVFVIRFGRGE